jgi:hypothetical protein
VDKPDHIQNKNRVVKMYAEDEEKNDEDDIMIQERLNMAEKFRMVMRQNIDN